MIKATYPQAMWETLGKRGDEVCSKMGKTQLVRVVHFLSELSTKFSTDFSPRFTRDLSQYPPALLL